MALFKMPFSLLRYWQRIAFCLVEANGICLFGIFGMCGGRGFRAQNKPGNVIEKDIT